MKTYTSEDDNHDAVVVGIAKAVSEVFDRFPGRTIAMSTLARMVCVRFFLAFPDSTSPIFNELVIEYLVIDYVKTNPDLFSITKGAKGGISRKQDSLCESQR